MADLSRVAARARQDWPAVLAIVVLAVLHVILSVTGGDQARPLGIPLIAGIAVFILAELGRTLWAAMD